MLTLGIDSGSTTTKGALFDGTQIVKTAILPTSANPKDSICNLYEMLYNDDVAYTVSTGYGRALLEQADKQITEITCHARGAAFLNPNVRAVVDIGGGSTDIAVISMGGRVKAASLPVAGNAFDSCIAQYVQEKYQIAIGPLTAEQLKKQVACCTRSEFEGVMEVRGHSWETNLPARRIIYTRDLYEPVQELAARIANAARNVLESTPPELAADVSGTGILLTGGGSLLRGLAGYIAGELHTDVAIAPDPLNCVARGTAISLSEGKYLSAGFRDATPKVWNRRLNHSHDPFTGE